MGAKVKPTAEPEPEEEIEDEDGQDVEQENEEPKVLRAEWLDNLEGRINENLTALEGRLTAQVQALLTPKAPEPPPAPRTEELPPKVESDPAPEPEAHPLFGFLTKAPRRH